MKTLISTFTVSAALLLSACHGQNPFDRNSDPTKDYPRLSEAVPVEKLPAPKPTQAPPPPLPDAEQNPCPKIFDIGFSDGRGRLMKFEPGQDGQITLTARSYRKGNFALELLDAPKGMTLTPDKAAGTAPNSLSTWTINWKPSQEIISTNGFWESVVSFKYTNNNVKNARCGNHAIEEFNVLVFADAGAVTVPVVSVTDLPQGRIQFGDHFNFKVTVTNAGQKSAPTLDFGFNSDAFNTSKTVHGESAVGCSSAKLVDLQWVFSCDFSSDKIADAATLKKLISSNTEVTARFDILASGESQVSAKKRVLINVMFPGPIQEQKPEEAKPDTEASPKTDKGV